MNDIEFGKEYIFVPRESVSDTSDYGRTIIPTNWNHFAPDMLTVEFGDGGLLAVYPDELIDPEEEW